MKNIYKLLLLIVIVLFSGCKEKNIVMSAVQDGDELKEGSTIYFELMQNYPNPYNYSTSIKFAVYKQMNLKMSIYSEDWELVKVLLESVKNPGYYNIIFDGKGKDGKYLPSGNYYYSLEGEGLTLTRSMKILN